MIRVNVATLMPAIVNVCKRMIIQSFYKIQILLTKVQSGRNFHKSPEFITKYVKNFPSSHQPMNSLQVDKFDPASRWTNGNHLRIGWHKNGSPKLGFQENRISSLTLAPTNYSFCLVPDRTVASGHESQIFAPVNLSRRLSASPAFWVFLQMKGT